MKKTPPVRFGQAQKDQYDTISYVSKDGRFTITKRMMASMTGRAGCFTERTYYLADSSKPKDAKPVAYDTLADAKFAACQRVDPNYDEEEVCVDILGLS